MLTSHTGPVVFPESLRYNCDTGYSFDGSGLASKRRFHAWCRADGELQSMLSCQKVSCGAPHHFPNSMMRLRTGQNRDSIEYMDTVSYTCNAGHTLDGSASGQASFSTTCRDNGYFSGAASCVPV